MKKKILDKIVKEATKESDIKIEKGNGKTLKKVVKKCY